MVGIEAPQCCEAGAPRPHCVSATGRRRRSTAKPSAGKLRRCGLATSGRIAPLRSCPPCLCCSANGGPMVHENSGAGASQRIHALDLVRAAALLLGIVFHAALPFIPDYELWLVMDRSRSWPVAWLAFT